MAVVEYARSRNGALFKTKVGKVKGNELALSGRDALIMNADKPTAQTHKENDHGELEEIKPSKMEEQKNLFSP